MAIAMWNESLSVGVRKFDDQHKKLFDLINALHQAMSGGKGQAAMGGVLAELLAYTKSHFADEEREMQKTAYPGYTAQVAEHAEFVKKVTEISQKHQKGTIGIAVETLDFLSFWLKKHIGGSDKAYKEHFAAKGVR